MPVLDPGADLPAAPIYSGRVRPEGTGATTRLSTYNLWIESAKLAFADREAYYGDPLFDKVPLDVLLSEKYASARRELIGAQASPEMRPGDVGLGIPGYATGDVGEDNRRALGLEARAVQDLGHAHVHVGDTTHLDAVDREGNMVAATPSGGWLGTSPVIPGLGLCMGTRGQMFYLNPERPNALAPRKRPRATLTPSLVTRGGEPFMVFGTPGGDGQEQWTLQFFLNYVEFGMNMQEALDAPSVHSVHFPSSFYPREAYPGRVFAESRIPSEVIGELERREARGCGNRRLVQRQGDGRSLRQGAGGHHRRRFAPKATSATPLGGRDGRAQDQLASIHYLFELADGVDMLLGGL